jgi:PAS domain S-box-containing protein
MTAEPPSPVSELEERLRFETLIADLSSKFVDIPSGDVDREIEDDQRRVCECLGLDLCGLWQWSAELPRVLTLTHLYRSLGVPPAPARMDASEYFPWCQQQLLAGKVIAISSLEELPAEAGRDREAWLRYGIKAALALPLSAGGGPPIGALSFNAVRAERAWPESLVKRLQLIAQIFTNALARARADEMLRESEERLDLAADSAGAGLWSLTLATGRLWMTNKARELFGYQADEDVTFDRFLDGVHPEDRDLIRQTVQTLVQSKSGGRVEYRVLRPDGSVNWFHSRGRVRCNPSGQPECVMGVSVDITERKRAEEAHRMEEERLRSVVRITRQKANSLRELLDKALEEAIALSDSQLGYIYYYSEEQREFTLHAWSREVMQECSIPNPPTVYQLDKTGLWGEAVRQRRPIVVNDFSAPNPLKKGYPAGHAPLFRYLTLPVFCDGQIVAVVAVANKAGDYTELDVRQLAMMMDSIWEVAERKRAEEAVRVLAGKLLTAQEAERCRVAREMHDDLTQRIAVLAIEAGKLEQAADGAESLSGKLREMKDQLIRLSQDVHALSRQLHPSILDDLGLVDALRSECVSFSQREGISIRYTPQDIPAEVPKEVALCLYRIAQEALRNIAKHSRAREARIALTATDDSILLSIEDPGVGFNSSQLRGLGLGLASMEERARLIGGELTIRSEPGKGTLVEVFAPCSGRLP